MNMPKQKNIVNTSNEAVIVDKPTPLSDPIEISEVEKANQLAKEKPIVYDEMATPAMVTTKIQSDLDVKLIKNPADDYNDVEFTDAIQRLVSLTQALSDTTIKIETKNALLKSFPTFISSLRLDITNSPSTVIQISKTASSVNSLALLDSKAIKVRENWPQLLTIVHYDVGSLQVERFTAAPIPDYEMQQKYYPENVTATAVVLCQDQDSAGTNSYFTGSTFKQIGNVKLMIGPVLNRIGMLEGDETLMQYWYACFLHFFSVLNEAASIVWKAKDPKAIRIGNEYDKYKADPRNIHMHRFEDGLPQPPLHTEYWNESFTREFVEAYFTATIAGGVRTSRFYMPHWAGIPDLTFDNKAFGQVLLHSTHPWIATISRLYFRKIRRLSVSPQDLSDAANYFTSRMKKYIPTSAITLNVHYNQMGKRVLELMVMRTVEFCNDEMLTQRNMLEDLQIAETQPSNMFAGLRAAFDTIAQTGSMMRRGTDPTLEFKAMLDQNPSLDDIIKMLNYESFFLVRRIRLQLIDEQELSGRGFVYWFNLLLLVHLFKCWAPSVYASVFTLTVRMFGLAAGWRGRFSAEINDVPNPNTEMDSLGRTPLGLLNRLPDRRLAALYDLFEPLAYTDPILAYNQPLMVNILGNRKNPFVNDPDIIPIKLFQDGHGPDLSCWGTQLKILIGRIKDFLATLEFTNRDVTRATLYKCLDVLAQNATMTNEAVAGVIGKYRVVQTQSPSHYYAEKSFFNHRREWIAECSPGYYAIQSTDVTNILTRYSHVSPDGRSVEVAAPARVPTKHVVQASEHLMNPPNMLSFMFNIAMSQDATLMMDPLLNIQKSITKTWRMEPLLQINQLTQAFFSGNFGPLSRYLAYTAGTSAKKSNFNGLMTDVLNMLGAKYPTSLTSLPSGSMNDTAKLSFDFNDYQLLANGVQAVVVANNDAVQDTIFLMVRHLMDLTLPLQHITRLVYFGKDKRYKPTTWTDVGGTKIRCIRKAKYAAILPTQRNPNPFMAPQPEDQDIRKRYMYEVSNEEFTVGTSTRMAVAADDGTPHDAGRAWTWMSLADMEIEVAKGTLYYIEVNDMWQWTIELREELSTAISQGTMKLFVSGLFRYKYSNMDKYSDYADLGAHEWFKQPTMFSEFPVSYERPRDNTISRSFERYVQPIIESDDGIVWKNPNLPVDNANTGIQPSLSWFLEYTPTENDLANMEVSRNRRNRVINNMIATFQFKRLYSIVPYVLSSNDITHPYGIMINSFVAMSPTL